MSIAFPVLLFFRSLLYFLLAESYFNPTHPPPPPSVRFFNQTNVVMTGVVFLNR